MATHELKIWPQYFEDVLNGSKTFEIRKNDRGYQVGDTLVLQEWVEKARELDFRPPWQERTYGEYTGRECKRTVTYILNGPAFGIEDGFCVMGLADPVKEGRVEALER
ncbi:MAG: DUF3850 domain-containing protein, partial [Alicyclobacillus sp.]|nr:DUF3850 domain-containing protein [Alicyclobacillus sp.]